MDENKKEIRNTISDVIISDEENSRIVEGYAILFNTPSDGLVFEEIIEPRALDGVIGKSNVFALLNHDTQRGILARSRKGKGTLSLEIDEKGLKYRFSAPNTTLGDELLEYIKRGDINESSFAFSVNKDLWEKKENGTWKRTIKEIEYLYDVSPVYDAAYSKTSVYTRGMEDAQKQIDEQKEHQRKAELETYFNDIDKLFN